MSTVDGGERRDTFATMAQGIKKGYFGFGAVDGVHLGAYTAWDGPADSAYLASDVAGDDPHYQQFIAGEWDFVEVNLITFDDQGRPLERGPRATLPGVPSDITVEAMTDIIADLHVQLTAQMGETK